MEDPEECYFAYDTGLAECVREEGSLMQCIGGRTVHTWTCRCMDGPDCNETADTLRCI